VSPRVAAFHIPGCKSWFNSNDHGPPHFHIEELGRWECRVYFDGSGATRIERKWGRPGPTGSERREIESMSRQFRDDLLVQWKKSVCVDLEKLK